MFSSEIRKITPELFSKPHFIWSCAELKHNRPLGFKILNAHKYKNIKKFSSFLASDAIFPAHKC